MRARQWFTTYPWSMPAAGDMRQPKKFVPIQALTPHLREDHTSPPHPPHLPHPLDSRHPLGHSSCTSTCARTTAVSPPPHRHGALGASPLSLPHLHPLLPNHQLHPSSSPRTLPLHLPPPSPPLTTLPPPERRMSTGRYPRWELLRTSIPRTLASLSGCTPLHGHQTPQRQRRSLTPAPVHHLPSPRDHPGQRVSPSPPHSLTPPPAHRELPARASLAPPRSHLLTPHTPSPLACPTSTMAVLRPPGASRKLFMDLGHHAAPHVSLLPSAAPLVPHPRPLVVPPSNGHPRPSAPPLPVTAASDNARPDSTPAARSMLD